MAAPSAIDETLLRALEAVVGARGIVSGHARLSTYAADGLPLFSQAPDLVVLPRDTDETARVMALLHTAGVPIAARGSGTGLTGGATPAAGGVVVSTARMRSILELAPADRRARVQAGVVNADLTTAAAAHGLFYAPDPSSQQACTIGGNVANNSGGPHCFRHGNTTRHLLGVVVVLADGEVLDLVRDSNDPVGLDLVGNFCGSEGTFGIVTEVVVKLVPVPERVETLLALFTDLDAACGAVSDLIAQRLEPSAIEVLDRLTIEAVEASVYAAGYPVDAGAVVLCDVEGTDEEVEAIATDLVRIAERNGAFEVRRAADAAERKRLWAGRKGAFGAMGRVAPDLYVADAVVPRTKLRELVRLATEICRELDLKLANVFHAGDGNLHPNISYDRRDPDEVRRVLLAGTRILEACVAAGGSITGEHGVGLEKRDHMCALFGEDDLDAMRDVRRAWDPSGRLNPDKLLPIRRCSEIHADAVTTERVVPSA
ncbi:putative FAD-linked oxidoreductase [Planctomycetes bacterium Pla163]|uniref:Putative FAD-linked oxidoreductase n=1 Tax=Rohdeia mirabilis TaxID=2528008 RepID=A0A518CWP4_9BACT|nr:putative FAD-linked oxidoreductase [Planctomycetes bacterium Pla163]